MNVFEQHILELIDKYNMVHSGDMVVAAVSGGYDSMCMLNVLNNLKRIRGFELCCAHVNHMLRKEADSDEAFVAEFAKRLGIQAYTVKINVSEYAEKNKLSFETAGRLLRYGFLDEVASKFENAKIATAHNANDSAESMLMHLMRGSGLTGLTGIRPVNGNIIRPLVETKREDIEKYCAINSVPHRHDVTNDSDDYSRNDVRHNIMPQLLKRCSLSSLVRTMDVLSADDAFLEEIARAEAKRIITPKEDKKCIKLSEFNKLNISLKRRIVRIALEEVAGDNQVCLSHIDEILKIADRAEGGKHKSLPGGRIVKVEKGELVI